MAANLREDPSNIEVPDKWAVLKLPGKITATAASQRIRSVVGAGESRRK
jgi:hypothetical protein